MLDDAALLIRFSQDRSNEAFAELVRRYLNFVYSTALRQVAGDTHLAEDISQLVFSDLARKAKAVSDCPVLARWLYTCTHHAAANAVRTEQRRRSRERLAQTVKDFCDEPARDAEWARIRPWLDEAMRGLSQRDSDAILMRFFEERSFAAIGERLRLNENAARMRVERALEKLREILSRRGITSTTVVLAAMLSNEAIVAAPAELVGVITNGALASIASGSGPAASILQYMSTTKIGIGAAAIVVAVAIGFGGFGFRNALAADATLLSTQGRYDAEFRQLQELRGQASAADRRRANLEDAIARLQAKQAAGNALVGAQPGAKGSPPIDQRPSPPPVRVTDPKLKADLQTWFKGLNAMRFDPFFKAAGFSPEQQERMLDLLSLQKSLVLSGVVASMRPDSVSSDQIT
jgi:RNA polymerase sigma factor (sigma-70 family)